MSNALQLGSNGPDVARLQQALVERGLFPPDAYTEIKDCSFGPATLGAVKTFQAKSGLVVDGIVGPRTWAMLGSTIDVQLSMPPPDYASMGELAARALAFADAELRSGVSEAKNWPNRGGRVDQYLAGLNDDAPYLLHYVRDPSTPDGWQGAPWCGRFARYAFESSANQLGRISPFIGWGDLASAWKWRDQAQSRGKLHDDPQPGRAGLIIVPSSGIGVQPHGHVVMVANVGPTHLATREGNSGDRVAARWRSLSEFVGFVVPSSDRSG